MVLETLNSLAPGKCGNISISVFFKPSLQIDSLSTSCEIGFRWVSQKPIDDESTLVQVNG